MGLVHIEGTVTGPAGVKATVRLVDSGVTYSLLREAVWTRIGLRPRRSQQLTLADGTLMERRISECHILLHAGAARPPFSGRPPDGRAAAGVRLAATRARSAQGASKLPCEAHTPVIVGEGDDQALLGVVTLEELGQVLNPFTRPLQPMRMML
ncbi:MAG: hypothetical protein ACRD3O_19695, partial [Terriglobia bacterium]